MSSRTDRYRYSWWHSFEYWKNWRHTVSQNTWTLNLVTNCDIFMENFGRNNDTVDARRTWQVNGTVLCRLPVFSGEWLGNRDLRVGFSGFSSFFYCNKLLRDDPGRLSGRISRSREMTEYFSRSFIVGRSGAMLARISWKCAANFTFFYESMWPRLVLHWSVACCWEYSLWNVERWTGYWASVSLYLCETVIGISQWLHDLKMISSQKLGQFHHDSLIFVQFFSYCLQKRKNLIF